MTKREKLYLLTHFPLIWHYIQVKIRTRKKGSAILRPYSRKSCIRITSETQEHKMRFMSVLYRYHPFGVSLLAGPPFSKTPSARQQETTRGKSPRTQWRRTSFESCLLKRLRMHKARRAHNIYRLFYLRVCLGQSSGRKYGRGPRQIMAFY